MRPRLMAAADAQDLETLSLEKMAERGRREVPQVMFGVVVRSHPSAAPPALFHPKFNR